MVSQTCHTIFLTEGQDTKLLGRFLLLSVFDVVYPTCPFKLVQKAVWGSCAKRHSNDTQLKNRAA